MPIPIQFDGPARAQLRAALLDAFPSPFEIKDLLADRLNKNFFALVPAYVDYQIQLSELLTKANAQAWIAELLSAALEANPANPHLRAFAAAHTSLTSDVSDRGHQRLVQAGVLPLEVAVWREQLGRLEAQTCRVEVALESGPTVCGTGFLLGPSVLMTNYHVMEPVYTGKAKPENVLFRFDYKRLPEGPLNQGVTYSLAAAGAWDLDKSESHKPVEADAPADRLDYALVRLAEPAGHHKAGKKDATSGQDRGWMTPLAASTLAAPMPLLILHHPKGDPLKLAIETNGVIAVTGGGTRLRHKVNTEVGSSGSPCFNQKLNLVALHHAGDPDFERPAEWNQAVPFAAILALLGQRNKQGLLGT